MIVLSSGECFFLVTMLSLVIVFLLMIVPIVIVLSSSDSAFSDDTVEPLTNDHPHQRPSLSYDHISCDGQWFLFVYESLTSDHPSYTTTPM